MASAKKILSRLGLVLVLAFLALQFVRPAKNISSVPPGKDDLIVAHRPPDDVKRLLQVACYDCHSNHTRYPWYAEIQPLGWWLADHVADGKAELNLSEFGALSPKRQGSRIDAMIDETAERHMPLPSYTWAHRDAKLTDAQIKRLTDWLEELREKVAPEE